MAPARKRRPEVTVVLPDQLKGVLADADAQLVVRASPTRLVHQRSAAALLVPGCQPLCLPKAHAKHTRRRLRRPPARQHLGQHLNPS